ncbi:transcription cofactor vestigial-like protein 2 isoform X1 [Octodon degus]|uniref:Transcription cofactor vestigial-like protein 2 isoform X1 n=2 Tax=Octodon degus TaxID=10160 RepID=A0A6P6ECC0_OCTDE|nr:transcription cofactor vestigial-like protein 2 isoform X1 [Octodon degus]
MSCLEVMYQVYGAPQPYFAAAYAPYPQKLAYYSKMQEAPECTTSPSGSGSSSFSSQAAASIKEEEGSSEKEHPPEAEYISSRCVLFTYFQGDISSVVDEHFSRALSQPSSYAPSCVSSKMPRSSGSWREGPCPMSQRGLPASFWGGAYPAAPLGAQLAAPPELPFAADPYTSASAAEAWAPHAPYALGSAVHEVYAPRLDTRFGPLLMPARPRLGPAPRGPACERPARPEPPPGAWAAPPAPFGGPAGDTGLGLGADAGLQLQDKSKDLYWF